jgi:tetratricopeptide (TPR) repeat protein
MATHPNLIRQAQGLLAHGHFNDAADLCIHGLADTPNNPEFLVILALCDEARGDAAGAIERLQAAVAADGRHQASHFQLGRLEAARGNHQRAGELFDHCLSLNPNHVAARTLKARLIAVAGDRKGAIAELKSALRADPRHLPTLTTMADLLLEEGQVEQASEQASRALRLNPNSAAVQMCMARVLMAQGHPAFAQQCLDNAIKTAPTDPAPLLALAALFQRQGQHPQAMEALGRAGKLGYNGPDRILAEARSLRQMGRLIDALQRYEVLVEPDDAPADLVLEAAECCLDGRYPDVAKELLARPTVAGQVRAELLNARVAEETGDLALAAERAASLHQSENAAVMMSARMLSTRLALQANDAEAAQGFLQPLLGRGDAAPSVVWMAAEIAQSREQHDQAIEWLTQLLEREGLDEGNKARTHNMLVQVLDRAERHSEAADHFKAAAWKTPFVGYGLADEASEAPKLDAIDPWQWDVEMPDDGRAQPILLTGWPGSGRELLFAALASSSQVGVLPPASWRVRRGELGLPARAEVVASLAESEARMQRRRFLRQLSELAGRHQALLEGGHVVADDLAMLARIFPGTTLIVPSADQADLEIYWRLSGFRDLPAMQAAWKRDQALLQRLGKLLPLKRVEVSLAEMFEQPVATLKALCQTLGLDAEPAMLEAMDRARLEFGYRAPGHWQNYQWTL